MGQIFAKQLCLHPLHPPKLFDCYESSPQLTVYHHQLCISHEVSNLTPNISYKAYNTNDNANNTTENTPETFCTRCSTVPASLVSSFSSIFPDRSTSTASTASSALSAGSNRHSCSYRTKTSSHTVFNPKLWRRVASA